MTDRLTQLPAQSILITSDGLYRINVGMTFLGEQNELLKQVAAQAPMDLFHTLLVPATGNFGPGHIRLNGQHITTFTRLPYLNIDTIWQLYEGGTKLYPVWRTVEGGTCMQKLLRWTPPATMALWYVSHYANSPGREWVGSFFVAVKQGGVHFYRLPMGNLNEAAQICMGNAFRSPPGTRSIAERFNFEVETFLKTSWNHDLIRNEPDFWKLMFSFKGDGSAQLPIPPDWERGCRNCAATVFANLPLQQLSFNT